MAESSEWNQADRRIATHRPSSGHCSLISVNRRAMACQFEVALPATVPAAVQAASAALDEIDRLEDQMTVYRDTSEVSRINLLAAMIPVQVEERLFGLFETALRLTQETEGAFDVACGALVKCWGFFRGPKRVPEATELASVMERVGSGHVILDREQRTIAFGRPEMELNLGAIGKGYALDRAAERLRADWGISSAILQGGRSSVYALGWPGGNGVGIQHPLDPSLRIATVRLRDAALGTSGASIQYFEANGGRFGHILDPRTGWPAEGQACVSVIAPTAAEADALSTALFILGPQKARQYCERHPDIGAIIVSRPHQDGELEVSVVGRAQGQVELRTEAIDPQPAPNDD
ncbi:MAG: FAD:protein FMN transferase [Planctomycetes bacterium]|nr:FAD:protein FMN transferase [Planctomycetota bacterium]